jgi:hypothetical protein
MKQTEWTNREVIDRLRSSVKQMESASEAIELLEFADPFEVMWDAEHDIKRGLKTLERELARREGETYRSHFNRHHKERWQQVVA